MGENLKAIGSIGKKIIGYPIGALYAYPTTIRKFTEKYKQIPNDPGGFVICFGGLSLVGNFLLVPTIGLYRSYTTGLDKFTWLPLLISPTTNIASGLYEWFKYEKNKINKNTTSRSSALETKVNTSETKAEIVSSFPKDIIPDPWSYDIDEIKCCLWQENKNEIR
jgi:hypothetical protein